jgi:signal transduction histidine kinase
VLISVSDTGVGLPPQQADKIFNAFFTTKTHGTGMGLGISRSIIESNGGRLWAADNSPRGARFCFTLPTSNETRALVASGDRTEPADGLRADDPSLRSVNIGSPAQRE